MTFSPGLTLYRNDLGNWVKVKDTSLGDRILEQSFDAVPAVLP